METFQFFPYQWYITDEYTEEDLPVSKQKQKQKKEIKPLFVIKAYGLNKENKNVCIKIHNFRPYMYLEIDKLQKQGITEHRRNSIRKKMKCFINDKTQNTSSISKLNNDCTPESIQWERRKKLFYADLNENKKIKHFDFAKLEFSSSEHLRRASYRFKNKMNVQGTGMCTFTCHEDRVDPLLQFTSAYNIPTASWIQIKGTKLDEDEKRY